MARAHPPHDEPAAHPRGIDIATFLALWDWLHQYLEDRPLVHHKGEGPLLASKRQLANEGPPLVLQQE